MPLTSLTYLYASSDSANTVLMLSVFRVFPSFSRKLAPRTLFYFRTAFGGGPSGGLFLLLISRASLRWENANSCRNWYPRCSASNDSAPMEHSYSSSGATAAWLLTLPTACCFFSPASSWRRTGGLAWASTAPSWSDLP